MRRIIFFICIFGIVSLQVNSQTCPANIDFEQGDFSNWECFIGSTNAVNDQNFISLTPSAPMQGRHEIISATSSLTKDPYGNFQTLCPYGGKYSVKLGNSNTNSEAEGMSYTFTVPTTVDTFTFTYFYAVVFEDPNHSLSEQPRFFVTAYDVISGKVINCASYDYVSNGAIPGFEVSPVSATVLYKKWTPASLQFAGLKGRQVRLEFKTADCTLGGHFGYAYLDVGSACSNILATAPYCKETNSLILNAPYGFKAYTWYNQDYTQIVGNQQSLTLNPPPATAGVFNVDVIPYPGYGCRDTLQANVMPLPVPDTPVARSFYSYCQFEPTVPLEAAASPGNDLWWYSSDTSSIASPTPPIPQSARAGVFTYYVSQKVLFGCESFRKKITVNIVPTPQASFTVNNDRQCESVNKFVFKSTSTGLGNSDFTWDLGNGVTQSSAADTVVNYTYSSAGVFDVKLKVINSGVCFTEKILPVTVVPKPVADFTFPSVICEKQTPVTIINTSSVAGGVAVIDKWWWSINDQITKTENPLHFTAGSPGSLTVKLVVTTAEGCNSDTNKAILPVHYQPYAALSYSAPLCDNEIIHFTDLSAMPQGTSAEAIVKRNWQFDNMFGSSVQKATVNFNAGLHTVNLVAESNFGCISPGLDTQIVIHPKPQIQLAINDSCVFRTIKYEGIDLLNSVDKWYWNFGNGFYNNNSLVTKTYNSEGYRPLTLIAQTKEGCKDTIIRPFTIYDNDALAGKDTIAAMGEPLQLNAHGGANVKYNWTPAIGLNDASLENPVAILDREQLYRLDAVTDKGCDSHSKILIKRYKGPELYIPTAFTPNNDGLNDILKVIPVGIKIFKYFAVYNRFGQRLFETSDYTKGWDGTFKGNKVETGAYVAYATAIDYRGNPITNRTSVVVIR